VVAEDPHIIELSFQQSMKQSRGPVAPVVVVVE
jgi:hypothetical protein